MAIQSIARKAMLADKINTMEDPKRSHSKPATELANRAAILCNPVNNPIADAVSVFGTRLLIHALAIPSVEAA